MSRSVASRVLNDAPHVSRAKREAVERTVRDLGFVANTGDFEEAGGGAAMTRLIQAHPDLDGVFAANDNMAVGALRALRQAGRSVPGEVSVVGFDDLAVAQIAEPALTTVHQPIRNLGREMARMLVGLIGGQDPSPLLLPTHLVVRASS
ncbi:LacI family DNA-binding transcriptional regulator [Streptomyces antibioticus]|uniref:LacI family DNA-binding transcriptional regulator n=1 Tax=Streptomyces antibioticus TaxID=1890 RepID=UPI003D736B26